MRIALAQLNFTVGAFEANFARMRAAIARAEASGADLVVFSEMAATGYPPRDLLHHARFVDRNLALLDQVAALSTGRLAILIGFVDRNPAPRGQAAVQRRGALPLAAASSRASTSRCCRPTTSSTRTATSSRRATVAPIEVHGRAPRRHDLRGRLERPRLLARAALPPRSDLRPGGRRAPICSINISASPFELGKADAPARDDPPGGAQTRPAISST